MESPHHDIAIIGSGFSGMGMAIRLKQAGRHDFVVLERGDDVGGTWRDNTYPGCQCDVQSILYSFSFALNPNWTRTFPMQREIQDYLVDCSHRFGVREHMRFGHEVLRAQWSGERGLWELDTSQGPFTARVLISGQGGLSDPKVPAIPGLDDFEGAVFHSARWDHSFDLRGKRVAVVGTGASAVQFVPKIQPQVGQMHVFQRTPPWVTPHLDRPVLGITRELYRRVPAAQRLVRRGVYWWREFAVPGATGFARDPRFARWIELVARAHIRRQVRDPELRRRVTPSYRIGCKRILMSERWYPALQKPNVELVDGGIEEVRARSVVGRDGAEREVDAIIFGTGFRVTDHPIGERVYGASGRSLAEEWGGTMRSHVGTAIDGFPNMFMLQGPSTGTGHTSVVLMIEWQMKHVLGALDAMDARGATVVTVRPESVAEFDAFVQRRITDSVWVTGGCASYYQDAQGRVTTLWPGFTFEFAQRVKEFDPVDYDFRVAGVPEAEPVAA